VKEPKCRVCSDPAAVVAVRELRDDGLSLTSISQRVKKSRSSIDRHLKHVDAPKPPSHGHGRNVSQTRRRAKAGRCSSCGVSVENPEPSSLLKRAERILWIAETIAAQAQRDDDSRLALMAVDRARGALETMMRAVGMIGGDGQVVVNVDARRLEATVAQLSVDDLRRLAALPSAVEGEL
jgi:hypothetical protein